MKNSNPFLSIVVPCYNEEDVIDIFLNKIFSVLAYIDEDFEIVFVNDGSHDSTLSVLKEKSKEYDNVRVINLSRNFGKEAALTAGLDTSKGEVVVPIDVDLQDPPELILDFIKKYKEGYDVVVGKRVDRTTDSTAKRISAEFFYKIHNKISDIEIPHNVGDYRLMSRRVVNELKKLPESQRFMKGLFAWLGFKTAVVEYKRDARIAGDSSFNGWKLWNFALDGITSFSTAPLRVWLYIGLGLAFISFVYGSWIILKTLLFGADTPGYASMITVVLFLGGIQLMGIGILGEYIGRIYVESKNRPIYIVEDEY
ncbi:glycosyltransferase family 2 protein [Sulfurimonas sp. SWIR-19]|uniref:glycosyltransferase family 2 protein n=1 Tax=Sulfurimonas sp. SWIR-19 TaxID=2878390 RepID=UPI001CF33F25|nr:glycosyltransferase family 2 protein [Sulfurimonas sp. SWIR-19]UCN01065.1 glycosyltransferase family 2 protein [Sulfurimonas sp. SWIR-19]